MNNKEWDNFKKIINSGLHICINISTFTDLLNIGNNLPGITFEPCTRRDMMKLGFYGSFSPSQSLCYLSKSVASSHIKIYIGNDTPINGENNWSDSIPIEILNDDKTLNRLLNLKSFW